MVLPIGQRRLFTWKNRQFAFQKIFEIQPRRIDILAVAIDEIHRHIQHIIGILFIAKAVFEHERQHPCAARIGVGPDMAAIGEETIGLAL